MPAAKNWLGNQMLFVSSGLCGEKRFVFTRREQRWGEGVTEQRVLNGTCPGTSGWNLEPGTWKSREKITNRKRSKRTQRSGQVIKCSSCLRDFVVENVFCSQGGSRGRLGEQRPTSNEQRAVIPGTRGQVLKILSNTAPTDQPL